MTSTWRSTKEIWQEKLALAQKAGEFLVRRVSTIRGIALTGSVAYGDVEEDDDLDFFVITAKNRVYTTRLATYLWALALGKKRTAKNEKDKWCLNMFLDEEDLLVPEVKRSEFARKQVERMKVIWERDSVFEKFVEVNGEWLGGGKGKKLEIKNYKLEIKNSLGDWWEGVVREMQLWYMKKKITREYVSKTQIFFQPLVRE